MHGAKATAELYSESFTKWTASGELCFPHLESESNNLLWGWLLRDNKMIYIEMICKCSNSLQKSYY